MDKLSIQGPEEMDQVVTALLDKAGNPQIVALTGPVGAGKTTFVQAFCRRQGVEEEVTSPTYALVNEYAGKDVKIFHLDLYRLESLEEGLAMGLEELLDEEAWCFIEWPEVIEDILPPGTMGIKLEIGGESTRNVLFFTYTN